MGMHVNFDGKSYVPGTAKRFGNGGSSPPPKGAQTNRNETASNPPLFFVSRSGVNVYSSRVLGAGVVSLVTSPYLVRSYLIGWCRGKQRSYSRGIVFGL